MSSGGDPFADLLPPSAQQNGSAPGSSFGGEDVVLVSPTASSEPGPDTFKQGGARPGPPMVRRGRPWGAGAGWGPPTGAGTAGPDHKLGPPPPTRHNPSLPLPPCCPPQRRDASKELEALAQGAAQAAFQKFTASVERTLEEMSR